MNLRPYQTRSVAAVTQAWAQGAGRVCLTLPTGAGKTITAKAIADQVGGNALWLVHRKELADQAPGHAVTIQGLVARGDRPACDILIADECHHLAPGAEQWHEVAQHYPRILGLTATPQRGDGTALGNLFDHLVVGAHYSELIAGGWLVKAKVFRPPEEIQGAIAEKPSKAWLRFAGGSRGFAFFSRVEHAKKFTAELNLDPLMPLFGKQVSATVWGAMPAIDREAVLAKFRAGKLQCLANAQVLTEGVDVPEAKVCLLATGCDHAGAYLQRVGRVLRPAPGKTSALLIDLSGASHRFGLPHEDREYSLDGRPIKCKVEPLRVCQRCGCTYPSAEGACPECGFILPVKPARLKIVNMSLEEVIEHGDAKQKRIAKAIKNKWGDASRDELRAEYQRLRSIGEQRGYRQGWAMYQYKLRTGRWPDNGIRR